MWPYAPAVVVVIGAVIVAGGSFWQGVRQSKFNAEIRAKNEEIIRLQNETISGVTGGDNFPYVYPVIFCDYRPVPCLEPFGKIPLELRKAKPGPLYNVTVGKAVKQNEPQQSYVFPELDTDPPIKGLLAEEGLNAFFIEARNGRWVENIWIERGERGWKKKVFVYAMRRGELEAVFEEEPRPAGPADGSPVTRGQPPSTSP